MVAHQFLALLVRVRILEEQLEKNPQLNIADFFV